MNLKTVTKAAFLEDAKDIVVEEDYHKIYQHFLTHFQQVKVLDHHELVIGVSLVYSWMPTIPTIDFQDFDKVVLALERIRQGYVLTDLDLEMMKACINNSLVGTSKLLHFLCPDRFPIWDSRVARYFLGREPYQLVNSFKHYKCYVNFCREVIQEPRYEEIHRGIQQQLSNDIGFMRSVEYVMFLLGKRKAKEGTVAVRKR